MEREPVDSIAGQSSNAGCGKRHPAENSTLATPEQAWNLSGSSLAMRSVFESASRLAPTTASVLIQGESGTGKTELAREIHRLSGRSAGPFVAISCGALTETLLESELFGHEKGAFTGAERRRIGRFEQANGGTLFLDEVAETPLSVQVKLLNVLQDRQFQRVGANESIPIDVRIMAATNGDLSELVARGQFRADLFYRLHVVRITMPALRDREGDVLLLADVFLKRFAEQSSKRIHGFTGDALKRLASYWWPGNVRELGNVVERAVVLCDEEYVSTQHLPVWAPRERAQGEWDVPVPGTTLAAAERFVILKTLESVGGSTIRAAEVLDISLRTLQHRLRQYGLAKSRGRPPSVLPPHLDHSQLGESTPDQSKAGLPRRSTRVR